MDLLDSPFSPPWIFFPFIYSRYLSWIVVKIACFDYYSFEIPFLALNLGFLDREVYTTLSERTLFCRLRMPLHPETLFSFLFYICLFLNARLWLFCYDYNETCRVELSNSRNPKVSYRVDEVNLKIELSFLVELFIIHYTFKKPNDESSIQTPIQVFWTLCEGHRKDFRIA